MPVNFGHLCLSLESFFLLLSIYCYLSLSLELTRLLNIIQREIHMNIQDVAFKFYSKILDSPNRDEIKTVVSKLKAINNKIHPAPVLGLLLYDQKKVKRNLGRTPLKELSSWTERELKCCSGSTMRYVKLITYA